MPLNLLVGHPLEPAHHRRPPHNMPAGMTAPPMSTFGSFEAAVRSANRFLFLGSRDSARLGLGLGLWQETEACLAPREADTYIEQRIGSSAHAGETQDPEDAVGLPGLEGHRPSPTMVWGGIDAQNQIARADSVAHSVHPLPGGDSRPSSQGGKDRSGDQAAFSFLTFLIACSRFRRDRWSMNKTPFRWSSSCWKQTA
jgi:hypothetical protein